MAQGSIKARIAALNLEEVHAAAPGSQPTYSYDAVPAGKKKAPPPPPSARPPAYQRQQTVNNPPILGNAPTSARQLGNQPVAVNDCPKVSPALPPRVPPRANTTPRQTPALPPRKTSERSLSRRESTESISTIASGISTLSLGSVKTNGTTHSNGTLYQVRAPAYDPSKLPPLPPKKAPEDPKQSKATLNAMRSKRDYVPSQALPPQLKTPELPARPSLPPRQSNAPEKQLAQPPEMPARPQRSSTNTSTARANRVIAPPPVRSVLDMGFNNKAATPPPLPQSRPPPPVPDVAPTSVLPPPIPLSSRPNLDAIMASKPKPGAVAGCLKCRDFSGPDNHAARFPRTQLPSSDVGWLAQQLCSPFSSPTDKARAIFTWLHHNVDYDVHSFFSGTVSPTTPEKTITSGLAVCEGYAGLFAALALKAGLQAMVCSGASKGYGYAPLEAGQPIPPFKSDHAWNVVKIDNGEWKLIDPCWGAGHLGCQRRNEGYVRSFNASHFTMDNDEFGKKHFPTDNSHQFRTDGRVASWEEFLRDDVGGRVQAGSDCGSEHGVGERTIEPSQLHIKVNDPHGPPVIRFQFATICPHWDNARHGKGAPYVMLLNIAGRDGRKPEHRTFNTDNRVWWLDVPRSELGAPGQKISVYAVTEFNKKNARGLTYEAWKNKTAYSANFGVLCMWELV